MLDLQSETAELRSELMDAWGGILDAGTFVGGEIVERFERAFADHVGCRHAIGLNSGTDALVLALDGLGIGPGDEVITTPFSFFATVEAILQVGATPVFADIDPVTLNVDPSAVEACIGAATKAILPVHLFGLPAPMAALDRIASAHGLALLEDAAQAFGATYSGTCTRCDGRCGRETSRTVARPVGSLGTAAAFSFYPTKTLGAYGDAGMFTTDDDVLADRVRRLRTHGSRPDAKYVSDLVGYNSRLDAIQAAVLTVKLRHHDRARDARRAVARGYRDRLGHVGEVVLPPDHPDHVYHQFTVQVPADALAHVMDALTADQVAFARFYPLPLDRQPALGGTYPRSGPVVEEVCRRVLSLPIHPYLTEDELDRVAGQIVKALGST